MKSKSNFETRFSKELHLGKGNLSMESAILTKDACSLGKKILPELLRGRYISGQKVPVLSMTFSAPVSGFSLVVVFTTLSGFDEMFLRLP